MIQSLVVSLPINAEEAIELPSADEYVYMIGYGQLSLIEDMRNGTNREKEERIA